MLVTNNAEYYERGKLLRSHGMTSMSYERSQGHSTSYDVIELGYNYRIDDIRSAIALAQLSKLPGDLQRRLKIRQRYLDKFACMDGVVVPFAHHQEFVSNYIFPIVLMNSNAEKREEVRSKLHQAGIQTSVHYPAVHRFSIYRRFAGDLRRTEYATDNEITLPMYARLTDEQIDYIVETVKQALGPF